MSDDHAGITGAAPIVTQGLTEQAKYEAMWARDEYRIVAPGESVAQVFLKQAHPKEGSQVIDFGAGTGRGALMLAIRGMKVHMLDFANNCLDEDVRNALTTQSHVLKFTQHDLTKPCPVSAPYGFCTDVMEHVPPEDVSKVLINVLRAAQHVFFQISCVDDVCGKLIGQPLHLSIHDHDWWLGAFKDLDCVVHWSADHGSHCMFYVTAWQQGADFVAHGVLNTEESQVLENVIQNTGYTFDIEDIDQSTDNPAGKRTVKYPHWQQVSPHAVNEREVVLLCGGPSLNNYVVEIQTLKANGAAIVTTNNTYHWAKEHELMPVTQIVVDAREFNKRFTHPVYENCRYLIASQCDPKVLEDLPKDKTWLWHTNLALVRETLDEVYDGKWYHTPGGSTVALRALPLLRMLGFKRFHMFGFDSCLDVDKHHAYSQPENDDAMVVDVTCGDRMFKCHPWMVSQASEFQELIKFMGDEIEVEVYGDGLIAYILNTGAELSDSMPIPNHDQSFDAA